MNTDNEQFIGPAGLVRKPDEAGIVTDGVKLTLTVTREFADDDDEDQFNAGSDGHGHCAMSLQLRAALMEFASLLGPEGKDRKPPEGMFYVEQPEAPTDFTTSNGMRIRVAYHDMSEPSEPKDLSYDDLGLARDLLTNVELVAIIGGDE